MTEHTTRKLCSICQVEQPMSAFHKDSQKKDGHSSWCTECSKFRTAHPEMPMTGIKAIRRSEKDIGVTAYALALANKNLANKQKKDAEVEPAPFDPATPTAAPRGQEQPKQKKRPALTRAQKDARNERRRNARAAKKS